MPDYCQLCGLEAPHDHKPSRYRHITMGHKRKVTEDEAQAFYSSTPPVDPPEPERAL